MDIEAKEILNERLWKEFNKSYNFNDIFQEYCEKYDLDITNENFDSVKEKTLESLKEIMFKQYKELVGYNNILENETRRI